MLELKRRRERKKIKIKIALLDCLFYDVKTSLGVFACLFILLINDVLSYIRPTFLFLSYLSYIITAKSENKCLSCRQYVIRNSNNFNLLSFYRYYNFLGRSEAETAFNSAIIIKGMYTGSVLSYYFGKPSTN